MNAQLIAVEPIPPIQPSPSQNMTTLDIFAVLIPLGIAAIAYLRQSLETKTTGEEAEEALIKTLNQQLEAQQEEIYRLRNELRITRQTLENSGEFAPPVPRRTEAKYE